jgi:perosamine synthetase
MGVAQIESIQEFLETKKRNYKYYKERIDMIEGLHLAEAPEYADNNYWMYGLQIEAGKYKHTKEELMDELHKARIQTRPVWHLNHLQKMYKECETYKIEKAIKLQNKTLNIPCSTNLIKKQIDTVINLL